MSGTRLTFKANRNIGRHGWLRLTPAYSVHLVEDLVSDLGPYDRVLDPFCGTGTTALACAERGIPCVTTDINPFLVWFARVKTRHYEPDVTAEVQSDLNVLIEKAASDEPWVPPMQYIDRWWSPETVIELGKLRNAIEESGKPSQVADLLKIALCQTLMEHSRANFRHQSVSLKHDISHKLNKNNDTKTAIISSFQASVLTIIEQIEATSIIYQPTIQLHDARNPFEFSKNGLAGDMYTAVITSPPYANRMSYIRELRPCMYWLGFLESGHQAGTLDWEAIGGTWGVATSRLSKWTPAESSIEDPAIHDAIDAIESQSLILGRYIRRYVEDAAQHLRSLRRSLAPGAKVTYIVGNSRFYESTLDTERIYAQLFASIGLHDVTITTLRKRTSKKELFEYAVSGVAD